MKDENPMSIGYVYTREIVRKGSLIDFSGTSRAAVVVKNGTKEFQSISKYLSNNKIIDFYDESSDCFNIHSFLKHFLVFRLFHKF